MDTRRTLILVGLAAVTFALGAAAVSGSMASDDGQDATAPEETEPAEPTSAPASEVDVEDAQEDEDEELPREHPGVPVETFEADLSEDLETGQLDLRVDHGHALVIGWDEPAYKVMVLQDEVPEDRIGDHETEVEFEDASNDQHLDLSVVAERSSPHSTQVNPQEGSAMHGDDVQLAIVAYVPKDIAYESVYACSGQDNFLNEAFHQLGELAGVSRSGHEACLPAPETPQALGHVTIMNQDSEDRERVERVSGMENLEGEDALFDMRTGTIVLSDVTLENVTAVTRYGDASLERAEADNLALDTRHGEILADDIDASTVALETRYGNVNATALAAEDLFVETRHGNVNVDTDAQAASLNTRHGQASVTGTVADLVVETRHGDIHLAPNQVRTGAIETITRHGTVTAELPEDPGTGYNVLGQSDNGDVTIELEDAEIVASDEDAGEEHVRTSGFDDKAVQVTMTSETRNGDVFIVEGEMDALDQEEDVDEHDEEEEASPLGLEL